MCLVSLLTITLVTCLVVTIIVGGVTRGVSLVTKASALLSLSSQCGVGVKKDERAGGGGRADAV